MKKEITYDELLAKIPNKYILTIVAGERARERAKERVFNEYSIDSVWLRMVKIWKDSLVEKIVH